MVVIRYLNALIPDMLQVFRQLRLTQTKFLANSPLVPVALVLISLWIVFNLSLEVSY